MIKVVFITKGKNKSNLESLVNSYSNKGFELAGVLPKGAKNWTFSELKKPNVSVEFLDIIFVESDNKFSYSLFRENDYLDFYKNPENKFEFAYFNLEWISKNEKIAFEFNNEDVVFLKQKEF
jgi:hypothetical protein